MKKVIACLFAVAVIFNQLVHPMEVAGGQEDVVMLENVFTGATVSIPKDLLPFVDLSRYGNKISVYLDTSFFPFLKQLLYAHATMQCTQRLGFKCMKDMQQLLSNSQYAQSGNFVSWFELIYLVDMFGLPSLMKDLLLIHITRLIKDHENEAAQATATVEDPSRQLSIGATWKMVAALYNAIFDQELEIEGFAADYGCSVQQLLMIGKINSSCYRILKTSSGAAVVNLNLERLNINSLEGWELLNNLVKNTQMSLIANLTNLNLRENKISFLPDNFLSQSPNVKGLDLSHNQLTALPDNFLSQSHNLILLRLSYNRLMALPDSFLSPSPNLQELDLSSNQLTTLSDNFLSQSPHLKSLKLAHNHIVVLPNNFLSQSPHLGALDLSNNQLAVLSDNFLSQSSDLVQVDLSHNKLTALSDNFLSPSANLIILRLSNNRLTALPHNFLLQSPNLEELELSYNQLMVLPHNFLSQSPNLKELSLAYNQLRALPDNFLSQSSKLKILHLNGNQLIALYHLFLVNSPKIKEFMIKNADGTYPEGHLSSQASLALEVGETALANDERKKRKQEEESIDQPESKRSKQ